MLHFFLDFYFRCEKIFFPQTSPRSEHKIILTPHELLHYSPLHHRMIAVISYQPLLMVKKKKAAKATKKKKVAKKAAPKRKATKKKATKKKK